MGKWARKRDQAAGDAGVPPREPQALPFCYPNRRAGGGTVRTVRPSPVIPRWNRGQSGHGKNRDRAPGEEARRK